MLCCSSDLVLLGIAVSGIIMEVVMIGSHILSLFYAKFYMNKPIFVSNHKRFKEGVSILKPLKECDSTLSDNLETFFLLDYPLFEILFCIQDPLDPAHNIVLELIKKHPRVDAKICSVATNVGANPKINNMMAGYDVMKYKWFWISDSCTFVQPNSLNSLMTHMDDDVTLVHANPCFANRSSVTGGIEKIFFGTYHSRWYILAHILGFTFLSGSSNLIRKDNFEKCFGGLAELSKYIAEDYFMAKILSEKGYKVTLATKPVILNSEFFGINAYIERMKRWTKLRIAMVPLAVFLELLTDCFITGFIFSWTSYYLFSWNMFVVFNYHLLAWFLFDYIFIKTLEKSNFQMKKIDFIAAWLMREFLVPYILFAAICNPTLRWKKRIFKLKCGGTAEEIANV